MMALCITATSVLADEVLYCTDTAETGFQWDKNGATRHGLFKGERFTIKVISETERSIARMVGITEALPYVCHGLPWQKPPPRDGPITCVDISGDEPWVFYKNNYVRAFLAGPPAGGGDPKAKSMHPISMRKRHAERPSFGSDRTVRLAKA
jgi:hypothetical protein